MDPREKQRRHAQPGSLFADAEGDPQEHMVEPETPLAWAHAIADGEASGLD